MDLSNVHLATIARTIGLQNIVVASPSLAGPLPSSILSTALEAVIGAVWMDSRDMDTVARVMSNIGLA